jgi:hypothetical protein
MTAHKTRSAGYKDFHACHLDLYRLSSRNQLLFSY